MKYQSLFTERKTRKLLAICMLSAEFAQRVVTVKAEEAVLWSLILSPF